MWVCVFCTTFKEKKGLLLTSTVHPSIKTNLFPFQTGDWWRLFNSAACSLQIKPEKKKPFSAALMSNEIIRAEGGGFSSFKHTLKEPLTSKFSFLKAAELLCWLIWGGPNETSWLWCYFRCLNIYLNAFGANIWFVLSWRWQMSVEIKVFDRLSFNSLRLQRNIFSSPPCRVELAL